MHRFLHRALPMSRSPLLLRISLPCQIASKPTPRDRELPYLSSLAQRLAVLLGGDLVGVYAGGSWALGGYRPGASDLDVAVVVRSSLPRETKRRIVESVRYEAIACPAPKLELVVYRLETARSSTAARDFELNLNTGARVPLRADYGESEEADHWFPIDRSILAQAGFTVLGAPAEQAFAQVQPAALASVLVKSLRWYRDRAEDSEAVLSACRALRFVTEGSWSSKPAAARWAAARGLAPPALAASACAALHRPAPLDHDEVVRFLDAAETRIASD
jgi:hypothetical protein